MASKEIVYIHELPFQPRKILCQILDVDKRWEELGGMYMEYDVTTITLIGQAIYRDKSPTWELLDKYSERNGTIKSLFLMLHKMRHQRAMSVLKPYVDPKYHCFLRDDTSLTTTQMSCCLKEDLHKTSTSQIVNSQSHCNSKFSSNGTNMNLELSSVSLHSKLNSLNGAKGTGAKKSPDTRNLKKTSTQYEEASLSDNCISEKMKESVKKQSKPKVSENGKSQKVSAPLSVAINPEDCRLDIRRISYEDIRKATDNFNQDRILGRGGFGTVYCGEWNFTSVAIKRLTPRHRTDDPSQQLVSLKQSLNELNILKCCRFDHILPLYAVSLDGEYPCLVYQLMVNGSLEDRLLLKNHTPPLTWSQRSHIAECTTKGLNYLHTTPEKPLVHGDIKSANILLDANMDAKIGDFGLTREGPGCLDTHVQVSSVHGTECYLPDEYRRHKHLSPQVDIYSYGIVLLEIATGLRPFDVRRGKGKRLTDHVRLSAEAGLLETLRDVKAGEEKMIWFLELVRIGQVCSSEEKKKRPPMSQVLVQFEKIKKEMSMMEKIRRLSSDKGSSPPNDLSPIERQLFYDLQKPSTTSPQNLSPAPLHEDPAPQEPNSAQVGTWAKEVSCDKNAPIPLLTVLRLQVSQVEETSDLFSSPSSNYTRDDYTSEVQTEE